VGPTLCCIAVACWAGQDQATTYQLDVRGTVTVSARGPVEAGVTGTPPDPYYSITLGGPAGKAGAVFTRVGSAPPPVGVYPVGDSALGREGFSGIIITGMPAHPDGIFRIQRGTLSVTASTPCRMTGRFELRAAGFLTEAPTASEQVITATGTFTAPVRPRCEPRR
jgi:hypothetical protein